MFLDRQVRVAAGQEAEVAEVAVVAATVIAVTAADPTPRAVPKG